MPSLQMFCRRWNIGTDDFVYISLYELLLLFALILIYFLYIDISESPFKCDINQFQRIIYFGLGLSILCSIIMTIVLMVISAQGTIMDASRRAAVPYCIYCKIAIIFVEIILSGIEYFLSNETKIPLGNCSKQIIRIYQIIFYSRLLCLLTYAFIFWLYFDRFGRVGLYQKSTNQLSETADLIKRKRIWRDKLRCLLCIFRPSYEEKNTIDDVAQIMAMIDNGSDLVRSDYQAGFYLMKLEDDRLDNLSGCTLQHFHDFEDSGFYNNDELDKRFLILANNNNSFEDSIYVPLSKERGTIVSEKKPISKLFISVLSCLNVKSKESNHTEKSEYLTKTTKYIDPFLNQNFNTINDLKLSFSRTLSKNSNEASIDTSDWRDLRVVYYFATMAKASYGWPLNLIFRHNDSSCWRFCREVFCSYSRLQCCSDCKCCKNEMSDSQKHVIIYPKGKFCAYHRRAILNETNLQKEDLICISFYNKENYLPFFVAVSHEMKIIILSIRGTFSMKDILTDLNLNLIGFEEESLEGCLAHSGMVKCACQIKRTLFQSDIISNIMNKYNEYSLVFTGHSLGAGVAAILACMLYKDYPNLKCYAFGIPMASVNVKMAEYCKNFVLTVVNEYDWVPRLSLNSIKAVKSRLNNCLLNSHIAKFRLTAAMCGFCRYPVATNTDQWNILNVFERDGSIPQNSNSDTKLPGQIIHIVNLTSLPGIRKMDFIDETKNIFIPIITSSEQFNSLIIRYDMFVDHSPSVYVNRLYTILKLNNMFTPRYHHYLAHYWPCDKPEDNTKLPSLGFLVEDEIRNGTSSLSKNNDSTVFEVISVV